MSGFLGYVVIAVLSSAGGFLGGWATAGGRIGELEARILAAETAVLRQSEMLERLVSAMTNIVILADHAGDSEQAASIAMLARHALRG